MGKRQHQKDKMYITYNEWTTLYGGKKEGPEVSTFKRLPFNHCCVSLQPYDNPYCDKDGNVFEYLAVLKYIRKFKHNPVTGKPLDSRSLLKLNFHKNAAGDYHCPVLYKPLTKHSHIVAITTTGNVFSYEAIERLNIKTRNWKDLLTDEPFQRKDILTIQDPQNLEKFNLETFHHLKNNLRVETEEELEAKGNPEARLKTVSKETRDILDELNRDYKAPEKKEEEEKKADKLNAAHYSTGKVAASFTSTALQPETRHEAAIIEEDTVRYQRVKKKGYVRLCTNFGPLNLELYCDKVPKTCENFIKLCQQGYYDNTKFHRSVRNFMIQGGDPTGTGLGGESVWGKPFADEFKFNLTHLGRGVLAMANSGPNTNKSQFYITYRSCRHLDNKHTVFGKVVGGLETLNSMEQIEVDNKDRPIEDIILEKAQIFVNPYEEVDEQLVAEREEEMKKLKADQAKLPSTTVAPGQELKKFREGVGKYINPSITKAKSTTASSQGQPSEKKKKVDGYKFGNFSEW